MAARQVVISNTVNGPYINAFAALDFDKDGCYNTPAIDAQGNVNPGLECGGALNGHCRDKEDLENNNVYSRARCNNGWCIFMYAYYFEKDQTALWTCGVGHKHDWEHIAVWVKDDVAVYVSVSQHKGWDCREAKDVRWHQGNHPKAVYHQDGGLTHDFRFANTKDDDIENHMGVWFVSFGFPSFPRSPLALI
ncbi:necrosis inducing protein [Camillea tinctor]|nr:necrosis inducing protein [Camillea tinctor]